MKSIADVVSGAGLAGYAEVALTIFFLVFVAIGLRVVLSRQSTYAHEAQLPLDEPGTGSGGNWGHGNWGQTPDNWGQTPISPKNWGQTPISPKNWGQTPISPKNWGQTPIPSTDANSTRLARGEQ